MEMNFCIKDFDGSLGMKNSLFRFPLILAVALCGLAGCRSDECEENRPQDQQAELAQSNAKKAKNAKNKSKKFRDPVNDMFQIKREQSEPFVLSGGSDILTPQEQEIFKQSWQSQHDNAEKVHKTTREKWDSERKKRSDWVW